MSQNMITELPKPVGPNIRVTISIPSIQSEYKTTFDSNMSIKQVIFNLFV